MRIMSRSVAAGKRRHRARHRIVLLLEEDRDVLRLNLSKQCGLPSSEGLDNILKSATVASAA